jgi:predicted ferric reductase
MLVKPELFLSRRKRKLIVAVLGMMVGGPLLLKLVSVPSAAVLLRPYFWGQVWALMGLGGLVAQLVLSIRIKWLEKHAGLDWLLKVHRYNAMVAGVLLLLHPLMVMYPLFGEQLWQVSTWLGLNWSYWIGSLALVILLVIMMTSLFSVALRISWERWWWLHHAGWGVVALGLWHARLLGSDIIGSEVWNWWWWGLVVITISAFGYRYGWKRWIGKNLAYRVVRVVKKTDQVFSVYLKPLRKKLFHLPGQFTFVRFRSKSLPSEEHHFTISSAPSDSELRMTIKSVGDFTSLIPKLLKGDGAWIDGPYGVMTNAGMEGPQVMVAGGIGITPFMSMIGEMRNQVRPPKVRLVYINKSQKEVAFRRQLKQWERQYRWLTIDWFLTQEKRRGYMEGRPDNTSWKKVVKQMGGAYWMIVGPEPMQKEVIATISGLGVERERILTELFKLK